MKTNLSGLLVGIITIALLLGACAPVPATPASAPVAPTVAAITAPAPAAATAPVAPSPTAAAPAAPTAAPATEITGNLSFLSWYSQDKMQPILDAFKAKYPGVTLDYQNVPTDNDQYTQKVNLLASSGSLPDLFYVQPPVTLFAKNGYVADISNLDAVKALPAGYTASYTYAGKVYAYAPDAWIGGVFYNKDLFKANNLSEPTTWADFLNACKTFKAKGIKPISMAGGEIDDLIYWIHNTEVLSKDPGFDGKINTGETNFTQGYLGAFTTFKTDMIDSGYITKDMLQLTDAQRITEFATGKAAMTITGPWMVAPMEKQNPKLNMGIFPFQGSVAGNTYNLGAVNVGISISATTKNRPAAEAFINFLGQTDSLQSYAKITGNFLAATNVDYTVDPVMAPMKVFAGNGKFAFPPIFWTYTSTLAPMIEKGTEQLVLGSTTPDQLVKDLDAKQVDLSK